MNLTLMKSELENLNLYWGSMSFKTTNKDPLGFIISKDTVTTILNGFHRIIGELWIKWNFPNQYREYGSLWKDEVQIEGNFIDYVIYKDDYPLHKIEMKTSLRDMTWLIENSGLTRNDMNKLTPRNKIEGSLEDIINEQYQGNSDLEILIIEITNENFDYCDAFFSYSDMLKRTIKFVKSVISTFPKDRKMYVNNKHIENDIEIPEYILNWADEKLDTSKYKSYNELIDDYSSLNNISVQEDWVNYKFFETTKVVDLIDLERPANIEKDEPYNKEKSKKYNLDGIGRKPAYLVYAPLERKCIPLERNNKIKDEYFQLLSEVENIEDGLKEETDQYKDISRDIASLNTEKVNRKFIRSIRTKWVSELSRINGEVMKKETLRETTIAELMLLQEYIRNTTRKKTKNNNISINNKGNITLKGDNILAIKGNVGMRLKKKIEKEQHRKFINTKVDCGIHEYCREIEEYYSSCKTDIEPPPLPEKLDLYPEGPLQDMALKLNGTFKGHIDKIIQAPLHNLMHRTALMIDSIKASSPMYKKSSGNHHIISGECPKTNVKWLTTPAINEMTGGTIVLFMKLDSVYNDKLPWSMIDFHYVKDGFTYLRTRPFRLKWELSNWSLSMYYGLMATMVYANTIEMPLQDCNLMWLSCINPTNAVRHSGDFCYQMDHNVFFEGSYGKDKASKKIIPNTNSDIRFSTIMYRYKLGYNKWHDTIYKQVTKGEYKFPGLKHPVWGMPTENMKQISLLTYWRQLIAKNDGSNAKVKMKRYLKDELEREEKILNNPLGPLFMKYDANFEADKFWNTLITYDKGKVDWLSHSYYPPMVVREVEKLCDQLINERKSKGKEGPIPFGDYYALETEKNTSIMIPWDIKGFYDLPRSTKQYEDYKLYIDDPIEYKKKNLTNKDPRTIRNIGFVTVKTPEALILEESKLRKQTVKRKMDEIIIEMLKTYPRHVFVTPRPKVEQTAGGRQFFIQDASSRCGNQALDIFLAEFLIYSDQIINLSGLEKNLRIQKNVEIIFKATESKNYQPCSTTEDQTNFGDMFSVKIMILTIQVIRNKGLLTERDYCVMRELLHRLENRIMLIAPEIRSQFFEIYTKDSDIDKVIEELKVKITANRKMRSFNLDSVKNNPYFSDVIQDSLATFRIYGGVLGVFNKFWSVFSSLIKSNIKSIMTNITGNDNLFTSETHSDDSASRSTLPVPNRELFEEKCVTNLFRYVRTQEKEWNQKFKIHEYIGKDALSFIKLTGDKGQDILTDFSYKILTKYFLMCTVMVNRMYSETPSEFKTFFGYISEILQQYTRPDGTSVIPEIRWFAKIAGDTPANSINKETLGLMGQLYTLVEAGASEVACHGVIMLINSFISRRYGIEMSKRSFEDPPQIGGLWYALPTLVAQDGMRAQTARLLALAKHKEEIKRKMIIMMNTNDIWSQKSENNEGQFNNELTGDYGGAGEVMKDLIISWSNKKNAKAGFDRLDHTQSKMIKSIFTNYVMSIKDFTGFNKKDIKRTVNENIPINKEIETIEDLKDIMKELSKLGSTTSRNVILHISAIKGRYGDPGFIESYKRVEQSNRIAGRWGFLKRVINNPYREDIRLVTDLTNDLITFGTLIDSIKALASSKFELPTNNQIAFEFMRKDFESISEKLDQSEWNFRLIPSKERSIETFRYEEISGGYKTATRDLKGLKSAYHFLIMESLPETTRKLLQPFLMISDFEISRWSAHLDTIKVLLKLFRVKYTSEMLRHENMILALLVEEERMTIINLPGGPDILNRIRFNFGDGVNYEIEKIKVTHRPIEIVENRDLFRLENVDRFSGILNASLIYTDNLDNGRGNKSIINLIEYNKMIQINHLELMKNHFIQKIDPRYAKQWSSDLLTILLYCKKVDSSLNWNSFLLIDDRFRCCTMDIMGWPRVSLELGENLYCEFSKTGTIPFGLGQIDYIEKMMTFISISFMSINPVTNIKQLITKNVDLRIQSYVKIWPDGLEHSRAMHGNILNLNFDKETYQGYKGEILDSKIIYVFPGRKYKYVVTPWRIGKTSATLRSQITFNNTVKVIKPDRTNGFGKMNKFKFREWETNTFNVYTRKELNYIREQLLVISNKILTTSLEDFYIKLLNLEYENNLGESKTCLSSVNLITFIKSQTINRLERNKSLEYYMRYSAKTGHMSMYKILKSKLKDINMLRPLIVKEDEKWVYTSVELAESSEVRELVTFKAKEDLIHKIEQSEINIPIRNVLQLGNFMEEGTQISNFLSSFKILTSEVKLVYKCKNSIPLEVIDTIRSGDYTESVLNFFTLINSI
jgi:hypothetical protein